MLDKSKLPPKVIAVIDDLANDLRPIVKSIENCPMTTRGHYGRYMGIIGNVAKGNRQVGALVAQALIDAGANVQGIKDAFRMSF